MPKGIIVFLFILSSAFIPETSYSQEIIFCEQVDKEGNPVNASNVFSIGEDGGFFKILVKLEGEVGSSSVVFDVYRVTEKREAFNSSLKMDIKPTLTWFYKEITFFKTGEYHVYVYDERDKLLGVGKVELKSK